MIVAFTLLIALGLPNFAAYPPRVEASEANAANVAGQAVNQNFIPVEGGSLKAKVEAATRLGRANARSGRYWIAYGFNVKQDVQFDGNYQGRGGDGQSRDNRRRSTTNAGILLLRESGNETITKIDLHDLDRQFDSKGHPVYWLGRVGNDESLGFLQELVMKEPGQKATEGAMTAIALHADSRVGQILEGMVRELKLESARKSAIFWLGQTEGETGFLSDLVRNEQESVEIRKQAAFAIGVSRDAAALSTLQGLYSQVNHREVKKQIIFANFVNSNSDAAVDFLISTATSDPDREVRKQAIFWLGQKAGQRTMEVLRDTVEQPDGDTEIQKQAVFAISQRKKEESVPMLIKLAKTHPNGEVRKQAIFWLGQTDDERALEVIKEILSK